MSNQELEELKRELVEDKYKRYSDAKEHHEDRLTIPNAKTQPRQKDRHLGLFKPQKVRRIK